jgi:hypothetical protein
MDTYRKMGGKRVKANLDKCSLQGEKQASNALYVQVIAVPEKMKIPIAVPLEFITTARTSACLSGHAYDYSVPFFISV